MVDPLFDDHLTHASALTFSRSKEYTFGGEWFADLRSPGRLCCYDRGRAAAWYSCLGVSGFRPQGGPNPEEQAPLARLLGEASGRLSPTTHHLRSFS